MSEPIEAMVEAGLTELRQYGYGAETEHGRRAFRKALTAALALLPETERWWQKFEDAREFVRILWRKKALSDHEYYALVALIDTAERSTHWRPLPAPPPAEGQKA